MPIIADDPLRKVTLNLYEADCLAAEKLYGHGWSTVLRTLWHEHMYGYKSVYQKLQLGDLAE